ncbi:MAG: SPOR domain-containing protein [Myxococcales bacterium]|nr:SPOR domain-containing protein [Myxococcales bacterium]
MEDAPAPARPALQVPRIAVAPIAAAPIAAPAPEKEAPLPPPPDEDEPPTAEPDAPAEAALVAPRKLTLQVKAAKEKAEADAFVAELRRAGFEPHVILADVPGKGRFYRVRVGRFESMPEARDFQRKYKALSGQPDGGFITDL